MEKKTTVLLPKRFSKNFYYQKIFTIIIGSLENLATIKQDEKLKKELLDTKKKFSEIQRFSQDTSKEMTSEIVLFGDKTLCLKIIKWGKNMVKRAENVYFVNELSNILKMQKKVALKTAKYARKTFQKRCTFFKYHLHAFSHSNATPEISSLFFNDFFKDKTKFKAQFQNLRRTLYSYHSESLFGEPLLTSQSSMLIGNSFNSDLYLDAHLLRYLMLFQKEYSIEKVKALNTFANMWLQPMYYLLKANHWTLDLAHPYFTDEYGNHRWGGIVIGPNDLNKAIERMKSENPELVVSRNHFNLKDFRWYRLEFFLRCKKFKGKLIFLPTTYKTVKVDIKASKDSEKVIRSYFGI